MTQYNSCLTLAKRNRQDEEWIRLYLTTNASGQMPGVQLRIYEFVLCHKTPLEIHYFAHNYEEDLCIVRGVACPRPTNSYD